MFTFSYIVLIVLIFIYMPTYQPYTITVFASEIANQVEVA